MKNQQGQIAIVGIIFVLFLIGLYTASIFSTVEEKKPTSGDPPKGCEPVAPGEIPAEFTKYKYANGKETKHIPPSTNPTIQSLEDGLDLRIDENNLVTYQLVLKNVYISFNYLKDNAELTKTRYKDFTDQEEFNSENFIPQLTETINGKKYFLLYPNNHHLINGPGYNKDNNVWKPASHGMVFLAPIQNNGQAIFVHRSDFGDKSDNTKSKFFYILTDLYQEKAFATAPEPSGKRGISHSIPDAVLKFCQKPVGTTTSIKPEPEVNFPEQTKSPDKKELQLEYFLFEGDIPTSGGGKWGFACKPAIYLYPKEKMSVNVKVNTKGELTYTDPIYPGAQGWDVTTYPDGKIIDPRFPNSVYPYLYYESKIPDELVKIPETGYTASFNELSTLYQTLLPKLGLNETQVKDFVDYWEKALPYSPYYFVGVMSQENINYIEPLEITPKPDFVNRVRLYFKAVQNKSTENYLSPILNLTSSNSTLNAVPSTLKIIEWGGMVKNDLLHPFTCSQ